MKVFHYLKVAWLAVLRPFRKTYTANICGHQTERKGEVKSHGRKCVTEMPLSENGNPDYCLDCIAKMAIRCAWCGDVIFIGDPVTLYSPMRSFEIPTYAVKYDKDERCFVGCLGWNCAESGADRQGFWSPPGKVHRILSPIEMLIMDGRRDGVVIVNDLSDPNDLGKVV